jgi:hypothetical protein
MEARVISGLLVSSQPQTNMDKCFLVDYVNKQLHTPPLNAAMAA